MVKQFYQLSLIVCLLILSACNSTLAQSLQSSTQGPETSAKDQTFIDLLQQRIDQGKIIPEFATLKRPGLIVNKPTSAFRENQGTVLQFNIFGYPDPKGTKEIVAPLIEVGATVADQHEITLSGIEVIFHRRETYNPMQVWANTPPWGKGRMFLTHRP